MFRGFVKLYFGWSLGTLAMSTLLNTQTALLMAYLINVIGIAPAVAGSLLFLSKIYDGVTDPLAGAETVLDGEDKRFCGQQWRDRPGGRADTGRFGRDDEEIARTGVGDVAGGVN